MRYARRRVASPWTPHHSPVGADARTRSRTARVKSCGDRRGARGPRVGARGDGPAYHYRGVLGGDGDGVRPKSTGTVQTGTHENRLPYSIPRGTKYFAF